MGRTISFLSASVATALVIGMGGCMPPPRSSPPPTATSSLQPTWFISRFGYSSPEEKELLPACVEAMNVQRRAEGLPPIKIAARPPDSNEMFRDIDGDTFNEVGMCVNNQIARGYRAKSSGRK